MDRSLEERIAERVTSQRRGGRPQGRAKQWNARSDASDIENDWVHDKYEDDPHTRAPRTDRYRGRTRERISPNRRKFNSDARLRVDNLHYDLTEDDLEGLFNRIAPVTSLSLRFDRAGRSTGTAYVSYASINDAKEAVREFDGANAAGQQIRLALLPTGPSGDIRHEASGASPRNPFNSATRPGRSLFDRVEDPDDHRRPRRSRSRSPNGPRRSNVMKPAPEGVDRYVPEDRTLPRKRRSWSRSPPRRRRSPIRRGRATNSKDETGRAMSGGRPRKTQEELDREMEDYFGTRGDVGGSAKPHDSAQNGPPSAVPEDEDVDMIT